MYYETLKESSYYYNDLKQAFLSETRFFLREYSKRENACVYTQ